MYSQNNEEEIVLNYFGNKTGTFLDIGANDGITLSNTFELVSNNWSGTLVEASPAAYERLSNMYQQNDRLVLLNYAVADYNGEIILHESGQLLGKGDIALVSSTRQDETERWVSLNMPFKDVSVKCITFEKMIEETRFKTYDFISLDIEGMELDVLPQMDLNKLETKLICVEFNGKQKEKYDEIIIPQGFYLIHQNAENLIYGR
jgi:FkbM family methyltransferase